MCLSALFAGQKNILTFLRRASSKSEVIKYLFNRVENKKLLISVKKN